MKQNQQVPKRETSPAVAAAVYGAAGVQLAAAVVACMLVGDYVDRKLQTAPWLTVAGVLLGFVGGMINLVRILGWFNKKKGLRS